jgi:lysosomal-associated transmembrane protein
MPVNLWGGAERRDIWRTCGCFHVRTVTIFIGVWYLMIYILALSFVAAMFMYEPNHEIGSINYGNGKEQPLPLPTPLSKSSDDFSAEPLNGDITSDSPKNRIDNLRNGPLNLLLDTRKATNSQVVLLTVCNLLITLLMVYGAVRGKPSYLMPFFVIKVFDFCIFCLTMVGYFSSLPNVTDAIVKQPNLPYREELLRMDPQILSLVALIVIVALISIKAYIIGVIWNCYKYLMLKNTVIRGVITYRNDDPAALMRLQQNPLLPDLPDYETAVNDPRYAKKPPMDGTPSSEQPISNQSSAGIIATLPPPYSVAVSEEPVMTTANGTIAYPGIPPMFQDDSDRERPVYGAVTEPITPPPSTLSSIPRVF